MVPMGATPQSWMVPRVSMQFTGKGYLPLSPFLPLLERKAMTASSATPSTATLPVWNFAKFYKSPADPAIGKDIDRLRQIESEFTRLEAKPEANLAKLVALQAEARSICDQLRMYVSNNLNVGSPQHNGTL